ncbi:MAG: AsmA family protein [Hyphomicrobiales bacterium]|nr:AsmA family protein [Hyphomicrobiales bacterium]
MVDSICLGTLEILGLREILTIIGFVLVVLLSAALGVPYFVNWTDHKAQFEGQFGRILARDVHLEGPIQLRLLPIPSLTLGAIDVPGNGHESGFSARDVSMQLAVMPLLQGQLQFTRLELFHPDVHLVLQADGHLDVPEFGRSGRAVQLANVKLKSGRVSLAGADGHTILAFQGVDLDANAASLNGPYSGNGEVTLARGSVHFDFATGELTQQGLEIKGDVTGGDGLPDVSVAGLLHTAKDGPAYMGKLDLRGAVQLASAAAPRLWRGQGEVNANLHSARMAKLDLVVGEGIGATHAEGPVRIDFGSQPRIFARLQSPQINLDSAMGAKPAPSPAIKPLKLDPVALIGQAMPNVALPVALDLGLSSKLVMMGGQALSDFSAEVGSTRADQWQVKADVSGPGQSRLQLNGMVEGGAGAQYLGDVTASSADAPLLAKWLGGLGYSYGQRAAEFLQNQPFDRISWKGDTRISAVSLASTDVALGLDRSQLQGAFAYSAAVGSAPARLFADLQSGVLDLDHLPDLRGALTGSEGLDLALTLQARAVKVARFGSGMVDAGRVDVKFSREGKVQRLERLQLDHLGGANIEAHGRLDAQGGHVLVHVDAARLADGADLLQKIAPSAWTKALAHRAPVLSPTRLDLDLATNGEAQVQGLSITGSAGGSRIEAHLQPDASLAHGLRLQASLAAPQAAQMLRQLGFEVLPLVGLGKGQLQISAQGTLAEPLDARVDADIAGSQFHFSGKMSPDLALMKAEGKVQWRAADATPLLQVAGLTVPMNGNAMPVALQGDGKVGGGGWQLAGLTGTLASNAISGALASDAGAAGITGALHLDHLDLPWLASLVFGATEPAARGALWPSLPFAPTFANPPRAQLALQIDHFDMALPGARALAPQPGRMTMLTGPDGLGLSDMQLGLGGGTIQGDVQLHRHGRDGSASGKLKFAAIPLDLPSLVGSFSGHLDFATSGGSLSALVSGLAGQGDVTLAKAQVPQANPHALDDVLTQMGRDEAGGGDVAVAAMLMKQLAQAPMPIAGDFAASLAAGQFHLMPKGATNSLNLNLDLQSLNFSQKVRITAMSVPKNWQGEAPALDIVWSGPLSTPSRHVEATTFLADLAAREIKRQNEEIAAFEADIRERAFFVRRLQGLRKLERDDAEEKAYLDEQLNEAAKAVAEKAAAQKAQVAPTGAGDAKALQDARKIMQQSTLPTSVPPPLIIMPDVTKMPLAVPNSLKVPN